MANICQVELKALGNRQNIMELYHRIHNTFGSYGEIFKNCEGTDALLLTMNFDCYRSVKEAFEYNNLDLCLFSKEHDLLIQYESIEIDWEFSELYYVDRGNVMEDGKYVYSEFNLYQDNENNSYESFKKWADHIGYAGVRSLAEFEQLRKKTDDNVFVYTNKPKEWGFIHNDFMKNEEDVEEDYEMESLS